MCFNMRKAIKLQMKYLCLCQVGCLSNTELKIGDFWSEKMVFCQQRKLEEENIGCRIGRGCILGVICI